MRRFKTQEEMEAEALRPFEADPLSEALGMTAEDMSRYGPGTKEWETPVPPPQEVAAEPSKLGPETVEYFGRIAPDVSVRAEEPEKRQGPKFDKALLARVGEGLAGALSKRAPDYSLSNYISSRAEERRKSEESFQAAKTKYLQEKLGLKEKREQ